MLPGGDPKGAGEGPWPLDETLMMAPHLSLHRSHPQRGFEALPGGLSTVYDTLLANKSIANFSIPERCSFSLKVQFMCKQFFPQGGHEDNSTRFRHALVTTLKS